MGRIQRDTGSEVRSNRSVLCGIEGASAGVPSGLGSAFHKTGGSGGKNSDASKITKGLQKHDLQGQIRSLRHS